MGDKEKQSPPKSKKKKRIPRVCKTPFYDQNIKKKDLDDDTTWYLQQIFFCQV